ncbi:MAG: tetratricopeptide repeat protein [Ekhidna sp.]
MSLRVLTTSILCCIATTLFAQTNTDSLWRVFEDASDPIVKVDALNSIAYLMRSTNPDSTLLLANQSERLANSAGYQLGIADAKVRMAIAQTNLGNYYQSLQLYLESYAIFKELNAKDRIATFNNNVGRLYNFLGENDKALEYYQKAAIQFAQLDDPTEGIVLNNIGYLYKLKGEYETALEYLRRSRASANKEQDAIKSLFPIYNIGSVHMLTGELDSASVYLDSAMQLSHQLRNHYILSLTKIDQGLMFQKLNQLEQAQKAFEEAYEVASLIGMRSEIKNAAGLLSDAYEQQNKFEEALTYHKIYKSLNDSLFNKDLTRRIAFQEAEYEFNQRQTELAIEQQKEKMNQESELANAIWIRNTLIVVVLAMSIISYLLFRNFKRKRIANDELRMLNSQIEKQTKELQDAHHEVIVMNNNLEKIVNKRTQELKLRNKQLKEYLSSNSHIVRAPLARILGLVDLYDPKDSSNLPFINESLHDSATELDNALRSINEKLSDEHDG